LVLKINRAPFVRRRGSRFYIKKWVLHPGADDQPAGQRSMVPSLTSVGGGGKGFDSDEAAQKAMKEMDTSPPLEWECTVRDYLTFSSSAQSVTMMFQPNQVRFQPKTIDLRVQIDIAAGADVVGSDELTALTAWSVRAHTNCECGPCGSLLMR
jgi:hypothetical protein